MPQGQIGQILVGYPYFFSSKMVIAIFLPFFPFFLKRERGSALRVVYRNHGAHNNRRKPVT